MRILIHRLRYRERPEWAQYEHYNSKADYNRAEARGMARVFATFLTTQDDHRRKQLPYAEVPFHLGGHKVIMQVHQAEGEEPVVHYYDPDTKKLVGKGKVRGNF